VAQVNDRTSSPCSSQQLIAFRSFDSIDGFHRFFVVNPGQYQSVLQLDPFIPKDPDAARLHKSRRILHAGIDIMIAKAGVYAVGSVQSPEDTRHRLKVPAAFIQKITGKQNEIRPLFVYLLDPTGKHLSINKPPQVKIANMRDAISFETGWEVGDGKRHLLECNLPVCDGDSKNGNGKSADNNGRGCDLVQQCEEVPVGAI